MPSSPCSYRRHQTYIRSLRDKYIGCANIATKDIMEHLYPYYAKILDGALEENDKQMRANYDMNQPMKVFIDQIDDVVDIAAAANNPYLA